MGFVTRHVIQSLELANKHPPTNFSTPYRWIRIQDSLTDLLIPALWLRERAGRSCVCVCVWDRITGKGGVSDLLIVLCQICQGLSRSLSAPVGPHVAQGSERSVSGPLEAFCSAGTRHVYNIWPVTDGPLISLTHTHTHTHTRDAYESKHMMQKTWNQCFHPKYRHTHTFDRFKWGHAIDFCYFYINYNDYYANSKRE